MSDPSVRRLHTEQDDRAGKMTRAIAAMARALSTPFRRLAARRGEVVTDGVRYRPRARRSGDVRVYEVSFPAHDVEDTHRMRIRCTPVRIYHDLTPGAARLDVYSRLCERVRPGDRVLELGGGTGAGAAWLAERVGPYGAVVSLETDTESVRFARRRYTNIPVSFEQGWAESLAGEVDGAFDAVIVIDPRADHGVRPAPAASQLIDTLWRLVRPGGMLAMAEGVERPAPRPETDWNEAVAEMRSRGQVVARLLAESDPAGPSVGLAVRKPEREG